MRSLKSVLITVGLAAVLAGASGCSAQGGGASAGAPATGASATAGGASAAAPTTLHVSAATSLKAVFETIAPAFEKADNATIAYDFGASGLLQKQIEGGAPADVFASASPKQIDALVAEGLISADSTATFASNDLVIFVPKGDPAGIHGPSDLAKARRLTTGDPAVAPHGAKAKEWLTNLGTWSALQSKFVFAENAAQTLDYVARGEVDAGIGFASEVKGKATVEIVYTVPKSRIGPVRYVIAPLKATAQAALARKFIDFVQSPEGRQALHDANFLPAPAK